MGLLATLASRHPGRPVGQSDLRPGDTHRVFEQVHKCVWRHAKTIAPLIGYDHREPGAGSDCLPYDNSRARGGVLRDFDLVLSHQTYFQSGKYFLAVHRRQVR